MRFFSDSIFYHGTLHQSDRDLPYLLMLHGFMGTGKAFEHLINPLSDFCNPFTVDLAGHGKTQTPEQPELFEAEKQCRQIISILKRVQFDNLYIYGYSMGGRLAFHLITRYPEYFNGAVIESAHCGIQNDTERKKRKITDENRANLIEQDFQDFVDEWQNLPLFRQTPASAKMKYREIMAVQNPALMAASLRKFGAGSMPSVYNELKLTRVPIKLIAGEHDAKYADLNNALEKISPKIEQIIVENAGHRVHLEKPTELVYIIKNVLKHQVS